MGPSNTHSKSIHAPSPKQTFTKNKKNIWKRIKQSMMAMSESAVPTSAPIYLTIPQNVNQQSDRDRIEKLFPKKTMSVCSILQLICAGLAALTQVVLFVVDPSRYSSISDVGAGIWTGVFFGFAGGVGLDWASNSNYGNFMMVILFGIQLLTALIQGVVAVTTAAFSCRVVCCGKRSSNGTVVFSNVAPQSEQVAVPLTVIAGATAPTTSLNVNNEKPPKYEEVEDAASNQAGGDQYQRFE